MKLIPLIGLIGFSAKLVFAQNNGNISSTLEPSSSISGTQSIVFVTSAASATATESISSAQSTGTGLNSEQLGGIIGGCAGAFFLLVFSLVLIVLGRNRHSTDFDMHVVSSTNLNESPSRKNSERKRSNQYEGTDKSVKRYNFSDKTNTDIEHGSIVSPVVIYSDNWSQQQQKPTGIEKRSLDEYNTVPLHDLSSAEDSSAKRLSKYNFLSQAFTQMRTSYVTNNHQTNENNQLRPKSPTTMSSGMPVTSQKVNTNKPKKYQMYSMYQDSNNELMQIPPPAVHSTNSFIPGDPTRESTMTVGTLHAPLFLKNRNTPSPTGSLPNPRLAKSPLNMLHRDSITSEVSAYETYPPVSPSTPTNNSQKSYPFI